MEEAIAGLILVVVPPWKPVSMLRMIDFRNLGGAKEEELLDIVGAFLLPAVGIWLLSPADLP